MPLVDQRAIVDEDLGYAEKITITGYQPLGEYLLIFDLLNAGAINHTTFFKQPGTETEFIVTASGKHQIDVTMYLSVSVAYANWSAGFQIKDSLGNVIWEHIENVPMGISGAVIDETTTIDLTKGDILHMVFKNASTSGLNVSCDSVHWGMTSNADILLGIGHIYPIANNLPDISCVDFLKLFLQLFGFFIKQTGTEIELKSFDDFVADCGSPNNALDWSDKYDAATIPELNFVTELSQKNWCKYSDDDPVVGVLYNDYLTVDDQTLPAESNYIELPLAATSMVTRFVGFDLPNIKAIKEYEWSESPKPRIIVDNTQNTTPAWIFTDGLTADSLPININIPLCYFTGSGTTDLSWQKILTNNYSKFAEAYNHPKNIKANFWLSIMDIYNLDQFIPIYARQLGGYYIAMKITNWMKRQSTECELIKIM